MFFFSKAPVSKVTKRDKWLIYRTRHNYITEHSPKDPKGQSSVNSLSAVEGRLARNELGLFPFLKLHAFVGV